MIGKPEWVGVAPSPKIFTQLDQEETTVLAYLAWCCASRRPALASDVAALPDRDGKPLGIVEAKHITRTLTEMKIASVLGMNNDRPLSIRVGGFQSASARFGAPSQPSPRSQAPTRPSGNRSASTRPDSKTRPVPPSQSKAPRNEDDFWGIAADRRIEANLAATARTPSFVLEAAKKLRERQVGVERGDVKMGPVEAAEERLRILTDRISLYERWQRAEPSHPTLKEFLARKRKAVPELKFQVERAKIKVEREQSEADGSS